MGALGDAQLLGQWRLLAWVATGSYNTPMRSIGIKSLKNQLSAYVRLAAGGERVLVTDRDRVVAELGPPAAGRSDRLPDALLAELTRQGWLTPASNPTSEPPRRLPVARSAKLLEELSKDRGER